MPEITLRSAAVAFPMSLAEYARAIKNDDAETAQKIERDLKTLDENTIIENLAREWQKKMSPTGINEHDLAILLALTGKREETLDWREKSFAARHPWTSVINAEPEFDFIRDEPRFREILRKMNLE